MKARPSCLSVWCDTSGNTLEKAARLQDLFEVFSQISWPHPHTQSQAYQPLLEPGHTSKSISPRKIKKKKKRFKYRWNSEVGGNGVGNQASSRSCISLSLGLTYNILTASPPPHPGLWVENGQTFLALPTSFSQGLYLIPCNGLRGLPSLHMNEMFAQQIMLFYWLLLKFHSVFIIAPNLSPVTSESLVKWRILFNMSNHPAYSLFLSREASKNGFPLTVLNGSKALRNTHLLPAASTPNYTKLTLYFS